ncbi:SDR family NAD(P)-dependent oxidoreductase [Pseudonocardia aurantiaca]|uniref:SDR family NAD(P)-dependent oxidoreductase n=1 Tax=Pseudonocardia aurantiaca TaxID=75290 RepID=A0ABW4FQ89_9PSEU
MSTGKVAVVTGASRGIGKGVAAELGAAGWTVYVTGHGVPPPPGLGIPADTSPLQATADLVTARGGRGVAAAVDHTADDQVATLFEQVATHEGRLDLLVNSVYENPPEFGRFWERPVADWEPMVTVGLRAQFVASWHAAQIMVPQGSGLIVNVSAPGARVHLNSTLFGVSKAGVDKLAHGVATDLRDTGVKAVSLWPGLVLTELLTTMRANGLEAISGLPLAEAETPAFQGRVILGLLADPDLAAKNGATLYSAELAHEYGVTTEDGRSPASNRTPLGADPVFTGI